MPLLRLGSATLSPDLFLSIHPDLSPELRHELSAQLHGLIQRGQALGFTTEEVGLAGLVRLALSGSRWGAESSGLTKGIEKTARDAGVES